MKRPKWEEAPLPVTSLPHHTPARVKFSIKSAQQLEAKVSYLSNVATTAEKQLYSDYAVSMFVFLPQTLAAVSDDIYSRLTQDVRLHTPKVTVAALRKPGSSGYLSEGFEAQLDELLQLAPKQAKRRSALVQSTIQGLRLYACVFRTALRRTTKELLADVKSEGAQSVSSAAKGIVALVLDVCGVLQRFDQVGRSCTLPQLPDELQEEYALIDEFLLFEADRALMKLLRGVDKCMSGSDVTARPQSVQSNTDDGKDAAATRLRRSLSSLARSAQMVASEDGGALTAGLQTAQCELLKARQLLGQAIFAMEDERSARGYWESIVHENEKYDNETFTYRLKVLKKNVRQAVSLAPKTHRPSFWFADLAGSLFAGFAMALAVVTFVLAQKATGGTSYTLLFSIIVILGYIAKDRIKELGKRYLEPIGAALGVAFPDRVRKLHDYTGKVVGKCYEKAETVGSGKVPPLVQDVRHADKSALKRKHPSIQPERVIHYKKTIRVKWEKVGVQLQHTTHEGLDDVLAIDLSFLQQRMQPPTETHYKLWTSEEGKFGVDKVHCARTYHINIVLQIKSLAKGANEKSMVIQRARVIMDKACGIKRLENQEDSIDLQKKQLLRPFTNAVASTMDRVSTAAVHAAARAKSSSHLGTAQQDQQRQRVNQGM